MDKLVDPTGHYAGGWGVVEQPWAKGIVYTHNGSNSTWYSTVMIAPKLNKAFVVVTNSRDFGNTVGICSSVISKLVRIEVPREELAVV